MLEEKYSLLEIRAGKVQSSHTRLKRYMAIPDWRILRSINRFNSIDGNSCYKLETSETVTQTDSSTHKRHTPSESKSCCLLCRGMCSKFFVSASQPDMSFGSFCHIRKTAAWPKLSCGNCFGACGISAYFESGPRRQDAFWNLWLRFGGRSGNELDLNHTDLSSPIVRNQTRIRNDRSQKEALTIFKTLHVFPKSISKM